MDRQLYVATYGYRAGTEPRRQAIIAAHREFLSAATGPDCALLAAGVTGTDSAVLLFAAEDSKAVHSTLDSDPFHTAGLIDEVTVNEWTPRVGLRVDEIAKWVTDD